MWSQALLSPDNIFGAGACENGWDLQIPSVELSLRDPPAILCDAAGCVPQEVLLAPLLEIIKQILQAVTRAQSPGGKSGLLIVSFLSPTLAPQGGPVPLHVAGDSF